MSTNRRRPTGGLRRPQVAGRPRPAGASGSSDPAEGAEGALAVEERAAGRPAADRTATTRPDTDRSDTDRPGSGRAAATVRTGRTPMAPVGGSAPDDDAPSAADTGPAGTTSTVEAPEVDAGSKDPGGSTADRARRGIPLPSAPTTRRGTALLLAVTVLLSAAAVFFAVSTVGMRFTGAATNTALSDVGATATVSEQVGDAVTKVYSFDFARLDQAEADARAGITAPFDAQFDQIFGNVRQLAPKQQAVVTATVPKSAVASIEGDRATVYLFVNQVITRVDDTGKKVQGGAAARLRVDAQNVGGSWKIAGMSPA